MIEPVYDHAPDCGRHSGPGETLEQIRLTRAEHTGDADDLAAMRGQRLDPERPDVEALQSDRDGAVTRVAVPVGVFEGPSDHHPNHLLGSRIGDRAVVNLAAILQHGHPVAMLEYLVYVMRYEQDREAAGPQVAQKAKQLAALADRKRRGRLIEDQQRRLALERLQDVENLVFAYAHIAAFAIKRNIHTEAGGERSGLGIERTIADKAGPQRLVAEHDVLCSRQGRNDRDLLVSDGNAGVESVRDVVENDRPPVDENRAGIRSVSAADDLHQRRLASAVGADQSEHFSRRDGEVNIAKRDGASEGLEYACDAQARLDIGVRVHRDRARMFRSHAASGDED